MFVTCYHKIAIYEPAEGGYYYDGQVYAWKERVRHGGVKRRIRQLYNMMVEDIKDRGCHWEAWISEDERSCGIRGPHIGDGCIVQAESKHKVGKDEQGYVPYC